MPQTSLQQRPPRLCEWPCEQQDQYLDSPVQNNADDSLFLREKPVPILYYHAVA